MPNQNIVIPGADYRPEAYSQMLEQKVAVVKTEFDQLELPEHIEVFSSPEKHYRMRAEFRVWQTKSTAGNHFAHYAMFDKSAPKTPVRIDEFPIAHQRIAEVMSPLMQKVNLSETLRRKLFQIEFLCSSLDELIITLIYHKPLDDEWQSTAEELQNFFKCSIIGRSRKQRLTLKKDHVTEQLNINGRTFTSLQPENSFSQPNCVINQAMTNWLCQWLKENVKQQEDLLEMYCGNGNFTLPLSMHFHKVLATEISKTGIRFAKENCALNNIDNIEFVRLSGEETAQALRGERPFRRLSHLDLDSYKLSHILVDPPRAGLDEASLGFVKTFDTILYISCNPKTLAENLQTLSETHHIKHFALFDQFPYTSHCECGAILQRK